MQLGFVCLFGFFAQLLLNHLHCYSIADVVHCILLKFKKCSVESFYIVCILSGMHLLWMNYSWFCLASMLWNELLIRQWFQWSSTTFLGLPYPSICTQKTQPLNCLPKGGWDYYFIIVRVPMLHCFQMLYSILSHLLILFIEPVCTSVK